MICFCLNLVSPGRRNRDQGLLWGLHSRTLGEGRERRTHEKETVTRLSLHMAASVGLISLGSSEELLECSSALPAEGRRRGGTYPWSKTAPRNASPERVSVPNGSLRVGRPAAEPHHAAMTAPTKQVATAMAAAQWSPGERKGGAPRSVRYTASVRAQG